MQEILSVLILLTCFLLVSNTRPPSYIKTFRYQSLIISLATGIEGIHLLAVYTRFDVLIISILIFIIKGIVIPKQLENALSTSGVMGAVSANDGSARDHLILASQKLDVDAKLSPPILVIICSGIVVFTYFTFFELVKVEGVHGGLFLINSISVVLIGLFFMITRKNAISQIIGFFVIENGLFITALYGAGGMPFIVDIGIFIDLISAMFVMGIMIFKISEKFNTTDTGKMKNLRG